MSFYDQVLRELLTALGAALLFGNLLALVRRRVDARVEAETRVARARPGSPVRGLGGRVEREGDLARAPVMRSVLYMVIGLLVMIWGIASIVAS